MKKIILFLMLAIGVNAGLFAQTNAKAKPIQIQVIDENNDASKHYHLYVFETLNVTDVVDLTAINLYLKNIKGYIPNTVSGKSRRFAVSFDSNVDFLKSIYFEKFLKDNNLVFINLRK